MRTNYHTHTYRCGHADTLPEEAWIEAAIGSGFQVLGFSDHTPWPYAGGHPFPGVRMNLSELSSYIDTIRNLQQQYRDQIHIYLGLECEYYPAYAPWLDSIRGMFDYLILGNHWPISDESGVKHFMYSSTPEEVSYYADYLIDAMQTGWFHYIAHPDMGMTSYTTFDNTCIDASYRICRKAKEMNLPLEYNLYGVEKAAQDGFAGLGYPCHAFWEIAKDVGCNAIIGHDAHFIRHLTNPVYRAQAEKDLSGLGIHILDTLPGLE